MVYGHSPEANEWLETKDKKSFILFDKSLMNAHLFIIFYLGFAKEKKLYDEEVIKYNTKCDVLTDNYTLFLDLVDPDCMNSLSF